MGALLVVLQFSLLGWLAFQGAPAFARGSAPAVAWSTIAAGLILGFWSLRANRPGNFNIRPIPRPHGHLVTTGPYRWIRHPMYTSVLLCAAGASLAASVPWLAWLAFFALVAVLTLKAIAEERWLGELHNGYAAYRNRTKRFVPGVF